MLLFSHFSTHEEAGTECTIYCLLFMDIILQVKQYVYRSGQELKVPGGLGSQISRHSAHDGGKVVSPRHRPPLPSRKYSWYSFLLEAESTPGAIVRAEGLCQWKILVTPSGIDPATFRVVAQCLNQLRHRVPVTSSKSYIPLRWRCGPMRAMASSFLRFRNHTQRRITIGRTPLDEWSARRRDLYLTTHNTHNR